MTDESTPPSDPDRQPETPETPPAGAAPQKQGLSTGAKVAIGCGILAVLAIIGIVLVTVVGGFFLKDKAEEFAGGIEAQQEATETLEELEREHDFTAPEDGIVGEDRAERFFAVTDAAWDDMSEMEEWVEEMSERGERIDRGGGQAGIGDMMAGMRGVGALHRARLAVAEALEEHDMAPSEYVWTGLSLVRAYESLDRPAEETPVPRENLDLAADHRAEIAEIAEGAEEGAVNKGAVLWMAMHWGMAGALQTPDLRGLDTLRP
ncbi:MAG: hypothetical protein R3199_11545 [Gemmatimonadota bacterium]|nr:hypothetical protein [Gemmatimonadota bacterium]